MGTVLSCIRECLASSGPEVEQPESPAESSESTFILLRPMSRVVPPRRPRRSTSINATPHKIPDHLYLWESYDPGVRHPEPWTGLSFRPHRFSEPGLPTHKKWHLRSCPRLRLSPRLPILVEEPNREEEAERLQLPLSSRLQDVQHTCQFCYHCYYVHTKTRPRKAPARSVARRMA